MENPAARAFLSLLAIKVCNVASRRTSGTLSSKEFYFKSFSLNDICQTVNNLSYDKCVLQLCG